MQATWLVTLIELVTLCVAAAACSGEVADSGGTSSVGGATSSTGGYASSSGGSSGTGGTSASGGTNEGGSSADACAAALPLSSIAQGTACSYLSALGASVSSVTLWVADSSTNGGGYVTLPQNQDVTSQGHTYRLSGSDSLFGSGGVDGVTSAVLGYLAIAVDGVPAQIRLDVAGCATEVNPGYAYFFASRVTLTRPGCSTCTIDTVRRDFLVTRSVSQYIFQSTSGPQACSIGIDLVDMTL